MKHLKKLLVMTLALCLLAGCSGKPSKPDNSGNGTDPVQGGTYIVRQASDPNSFNPNIKTDDMGVAASQNIFNRLVKQTPNYNIAPDLAESWSYSDDNLELTFNLRQGVKWHDGESFSSADVKWTFDKVRAEGYQSNNFKVIEEITTPDENTVVFKLKEPSSGLLASISWLGCFIMPKHLYENNDWTTNEHNQKPVGTGAFKFESYQKGQSITLVRNEDYFDGAPYLDKLVFSIIPDANTAYQSFKNGEVDDLQLNTPVSEIAGLKQDPNYIVYETNSNNRTYVTFNMEKGPFANPLVREAVNYGIDREEVLTKAAKGIGAVTEYYMSPVYTWAMNEDAKQPQRDIAKAKQLIEEAGYKADANGFYFEAEFDIFDSGDFKDTATVIQANLKEIGINLKLNVTEMAAWMQKVQDDFNFDMAMCSGAQGPDASAINMRIASKGALNLAHYNNPELDALLDEGTRLTDTAERAAVYKQVQAIMARDLPIVPVKEATFSSVVKKTVHGHPYAPENIDKLGTNDYAKIWISK